MIVGGVGHELSSTKADVYEFVPDTKELFRRKDMQERREGPGIVATLDYVYVIGGKYSYNTCEKYNLKSNNWETFAPMIYGRYEPVATLMQNDRFIYVIGGYPQELVGKSIERYDISYDRWDVISTNLPYPVLHPGIFPISHKKFALLGGRFCKAVILVETFDENNKNLESSFSETIKFFEIDNLPDGVETVYPVVFYKEENKVFIIKSQEGAAPQVLFYMYKNFLKPPQEIAQDYKRTMKLPPLISKPNPINEY